MKITYLSSPISSQYGGGEKFLDDFTSGIEAEHEFIGSSKAVYTLFKPKSYKATLISGLYEPVSIRNLLLIPISIVVGLYQFIRFYKIFKTADWIISPTSHCETFFVIPWVKLFLRKPVLFMIHAKPPTVFGIFPINYILSKCWGNSPVTFVSNSQKELWNSAGCISNNQIVIYNGVKTNDLVPKQSLNSGIIKIGFLARLHKEKGCDILINALELIQSKERIEIIIAGDGPEKQNLISLYEAKKLSSNINLKFIGFQKDSNAFYESIDLLVFPSKMEGFSMVLLEAWERGLPVLTSNIAPFIEAKQYASKLEQELNFKLDSHIELASKIDYFIYTKNIYLDSNYRNNLHFLIDSQFNLKTMLQNYKNILAKTG